MKLTKVKLLKIIRPFFKKLGYTEFKDTITGDKGLFIKKVENEYYLSLSFTISKFYDNQFTATYYLSKITRWSSVWGDIPRMSYKRVSTFLTESERKSLLHPEFIKGTDAWWSGIDEVELSNFLKAVELTEERFLNQPGLLDQINDSKEVQELVALAKSTLQKIEHEKIGDRWDFQPQKEIDNIPFFWFKAAETTLIEHRGILNANTVKSLAADAWRQYVLTNNSLLNVSK